MYKKELTEFVENGKNKIKYLEDNFLGYITSSMLAGMFVGFGVLLSLAVGFYLKGTPFEKVGMGMSFPIALSLVVMLKMELFTSATFILGVGKFQKEIQSNKLLKVWLSCYIGNWLGAIILAIVFTGTGSLNGDMGRYIAEVAKAKIDYSILNLISKGILCNILVCLASWGAYKIKSEVAKLIIIFWCLFALITCGFEHSIANMTTLTMGILKNHSLDITLLGYFYNLLWVTFGNIIGGVLFVALPNYIIYRD